MLHGPFELQGRTLRLKTRDEQDRLVRPVCRRCPRTAHNFSIVLSQAPRKVTRGADVGPPRPSDRYQEIYEPAYATASAQPPPLR